jgi:autotransporter translocation and assembly factor TamB
VRRSLAVLLWIIAGLLACFLGTLSALVNTGSGRALLGAVARSAAATAVGGRIEIGGVQGGLLTDLQLSEVRLYDPDSTLVAELPRVGFSYRLLDLLAGRVVLRDVTLEHPYVNLLQHKNGRLDIEELLHLGEHSGTAKSAPTLVLLRNVRIDDGTVLLRLQARPAPSDSAAEIENAGTDGRRRVRRFEHVNALVRTLSISSPTEKGIRIDVDSLATRISDPNVVVRHLSGRAIIAGDSLTANFPVVGLPGTRATLKGVFRWPHGPILYDLAVRADSATLSDIRFIVPGFPAGAVYHGAAQVRSHGADLLEVRLDPLDLRYHGGTLTGHVTALSRAGVGIAALNGGDLTAQNFDLSFAKPFIDSLPFLGRLDGHTTVDGDIDALAMNVDWTFRDSLVPGWPVSRIRGSGTVGAGAPLGLRFSPFTVQSAAVDLGTARRAIPGLPLRGTLDAAGTLSGRIRNVRFSGSLRQHDGSAPVTVAHGSLGFDSRTDTLGVMADLTADTLSFDGLRSSFPSLPVQGSVAGTVRATGTAGALSTHLDLTGISKSGHVKADGTLDLDAGRFGSRDAALSWSDLDPQDWLPGAPPSRLAGRATGTLQTDPGRAPEGAFAAVIDPSMVAGTAVDGGWAGVRFADGHLYLDSLLLHGTGIRVTGLGDIGWRRPANGSLIVDIEADSVDGLDSLLTWATGVSRAPDGTVAPLIGDARASVTLDGSLDSLTVTVRGSFDRLRARGLSFAGALAHLEFSAGPAPRFTADVAFDSARGFGERLTASRASARGVPDSLTWTVRAGLGDLAAVAGGGRLRRPAGGATMVGVDSLGVQIPGGLWTLDAPVDLAVTDSVIHVGAISLSQQGGTGKVSGQGDLVRDGPGQATLQAVGVPIAGVYALLERDTTGVGGTMTATLGVSGTRQRPAYTGSFALSAASFGDFRTPYVDGTVAYQDQRLDGTMHVWRSGQRVLNLTAHLPLDLALEPVAHRQLPDTLAVRAVADSVDLSVLEAITPALKRVTGFLSADAGIRGTWSAPRLDGTVRIDSAGANIPSIGVRYDQLAGRFRLAGDTIAVQSLTAHSDRGTASVSGFVRLDQLTTPVLALHISADQFKALDIHNYVAVTATAELNLTGPVFGATLTGRGTVTNGVLYFADLVNKRVINLDSPDPWIASLIDTSLAELIRRGRLGPAFQNVFLDSLRMDRLQLTMGNDVWLRSSEANIQLTGTLSLDKRVRNYLMSGTLQTPRGTYRLNVGPVTPEFTVTQGTVRYFGTPDLDAGLNIRATHVVHSGAAAAGPSSSLNHDVTVTVMIGGTLLAPKLTLSADDPDLSQTEIISYLLFGQANAPLGGDQGTLGSRNALLTSTVASIVSGQVEQSVVSDLGIPIDYFEFHPGGSGDLLSGAQLAAGWQIGRKTFLVLNAGHCGGAPIDLTSTLGASLQFRISPEWRTEASFEPVTNCNLSFVNSLGGASALRQVGLDLFWERHY